MTLLGTAYPTCERCGAQLEIGIIGEPDPTGVADYERLSFKLPTKHVCRQSADIIELNQPDPVSAEPQERRTA